MQGYPQEPTRRLNLPLVFNLISSIQAPGDKNKDKLKANNNTFAHKYIRGGQCITDLMG